MNDPKYPQIPVGQSPSVGQERELAPGELIDLIRKKMLPQNEITQRAVPLSHPPRAWDSGTVEKTALSQTEKFGGTVVGHLVIFPLPPGPDRVLRALGAEWLNTHQIAVTANQDPGDTFHWLGEFEDLGLVERTNRGDVALLTRRDERSPIWSWRAK
jgi:hypothetical protein